MLTDNRRRWTSEKRCSGAKEKVFLMCFKSRSLHVVRTKNLNLTCLMVILILPPEGEAQEAQLVPIRYLVVLKCTVQVGAKAKGRTQLTLTLNSLHSQWSCVHPGFDLIITAL